MRTFDTGATRDDDTHKVDYDGFLSLPAWRAFGRYMRTHQVQADGTLRDSDNWKKGIPLDAYRKSMWRHFLDVAETLGVEGRTPDAIEALCALLFNVQGALHELVKPNAVENPVPDLTATEAMIEAEAVYPLKWDLKKMCGARCGMYACINPEGHASWHQSYEGFSW